MEIISEIKKSLEKEENIYELIGIEIKIRRISFSKTLEAIAMGICSVSYLSKLENNGIHPNLEIIDKICKKLKITKENMNSLIYGKEIFQDLIKAMYFKEQDLFKGCCNKLEELKIYRSKMIKFLLALKEDKIYSAKKHYHDLRKLFKSMQLSDLYIMNYLEALYLYKTQQYVEAVEDLKFLIETQKTYKYLTMLAQELYNEILYSVNSPIFVEQSMLLKQLYINRGEYSRINELETKLNWYYIKNGLYTYAISNSRFYELKEDMFLIANTLKGIDLKPKSYSGFSGLLYVYKFDFLQFKKYYQSFVTSNKKEQLIADILYSKAYNDNFYEDLIEIYFPEALAIGDYALIDICEIYLVEALTELKRYKRCIEIVANKEKRKKEVMGCC